MKDLKYCLLLLLLWPSLCFAQQPFTAGNIVVYRIGDGLAAMNSNTTTVYLDEFTPSGTLVQSIPMPVSGTKVTMSTLNTAGALTLSANGQYLLVPGVDLPLGTALSSSPIPCSIGVVDFNGRVKSVTTLSISNFNTISSAASDNGANLWFTVASDGISYTTAGSSTFTKIYQPAGPSAMAVSIVDGQLYVSQSSASPEIGKVGIGLPTTSGQALTVLPGLAGVNDDHCRQFAFADLDANVPGNDVLYLASQASSGGGLQKYSLVGGVWTLNGSIGTAADRYHGLAIKVTNGSVAIFATRRGANSFSFRGGDLVSLTDNSGYNSALTGTPTVMASAPTPNSLAYRGIALVPQPAPFTAGNIVAYRVGDGTTGLNDDFFKVYLDEYTTSGVLVQTIELPSSAGSKITNIGRLPESGLLTLSENRRYLVVPGFNEPPGGVNDAKRSVGLVDFNGSLTGITTFANPNFDPIHAAVSDDGTRLWVTGTNGIEYIPTGSSTVTKIAAHNGNSTGIDIVNGQLYTGIMNNVPQLGTIGNGLPTTAGQAMGVLPGVNGPTDNYCVQFAFADMDPAVPGNDVLYLASQASSGGGIKKYSLAGGQWNLNGTIGTTADGYMGLTIKVVANSVTIFVTRRGVNSLFVKGGEVVKLVDNSGYNGTLTGTPTVFAFATTPDTKSFRGLALVPQGCPVVRGLQAIDVTSSQATLAWTAPIGGSGNYEYAVTTSIVPPATGTTTSNNSFTATGLTNNVTYYAHVRTVCTAVSQSEWTTVLFLTTCTAPSFPLLTINTSPTGVTEIKWNKVFGAEGYEYLISTDMNPPATGTATTDTGVTIQRINAVTKYYIHVRSNCGAGAFSGWTTKTFTTACFMPAVQVVTVSGNAKATWNMVSSALKYEYALTNYAAKPLSGTYTADTSYAVNDLKQGSPQYMHVRTVCTNGAVSEWNTVHFNIQGIAAYPNPVNDVLQIRLNGVPNSGGLILISDAMGRVVNKVSVNNNLLTVDTRGWARGIYLVRYNDGQNRYTVKIFKQ